MSKKYVIEIEEQPFVQQTALKGEKTLYKSKEFNSLVFDQNGIDRLTTLTKEYCIEYLQSDGWMQNHDLELTAIRNYNLDCATRAEEQLIWDKGAETAWKLAQKIVNSATGNHPDHDFGVYKAFNANSWGEIITSHSYDEARTIFNDYKSEIQIGDVVEDDHEIRYLVTDITSECYVCLSGEDFEPVYFGRTCGAITKIPNESKDVAKVAKMFKD